MLSIAYRIIFNLDDSFNLTTDQDRTVERKTLSTLKKVPPAATLLSIKGSASEYQGRYCELKSTKSKKDSQGYKEVETIMLKSK